MKLIILDRDGVINYESPDFIKNPDEWKPLPGSLEAIVGAHRELCSGGQPNLQNAERFRRGPRAQHTLCSLQVQHGVLQLTGCGPLGRANRPEPVGLLAGEVLDDTGDSQSPGPKK